MHAGQLDKSALYSVLVRRMAEERKARRSLLCGIATLVAMLVCAAPALAAEEPVTEAANSLRTGWYPDEASLTPERLQRGEFG